MVLLGEGGAQSDPDALFAAEPDGRHGAGETALELAEFIVGRFQAIDADAHVIEVCRRNLFDIGSVDQRAVGGQGEEKPLSRA